MRWPGKIRRDSIVRHIIIHMGNNLHFLEIANKSCSKAGLMITIEKCSDILENRQ